MFTPIAGLINAIIGIIELLLAFRFIFRFFGIGTGSGFVGWLNTFTQPLVNPFLGILPNFNLGPFMIETPTILSMVVFGLIGYFISSIFSPPTRTTDY